MTDQEIIGHGGSRPVLRPDDGRIKKEPGKSKLFSMRYKNMDELASINDLTPRERTLACLMYRTHEGEHISSEQYRGLTIEYQVGPFDNIVAIVRNGKGQRQWTFEADGIDKEEVQRKIRKQLDDHYSK